MNINFVGNEKLGILKIYGKGQNVISSITYDSRKVEEKAAFSCIQGENFDGHCFLEDAIQKGATVLIGDNQQILKKMSDKYREQTFLLVEDVRVSLAGLAAIFYSEDYKKLSTVAVTGTNGKTTVATYVRSLLNNLGLSAGSIGTTGMWASKGKFDFKQSTPTTPESSDLHYIFRSFYELGEKAAVMEVSSIAVEQKRVEGILFDVGIHTNLSPEHLDYHKDFENYKNAKLKLFNQVKKAVVNVDDPGMADDIINLFNGPILTYSINKEANADVVASDIRVSNSGTTIELSLEGESYIIYTPVYGDYNVANLLSAVCVGLHLDFSIEKIIQALPLIENPIGRFQLLEEGTEGRKIILDYAHTPVALENLLQEVKKLDYNRLIVMIAGVGVRDFNKMPKMAAVVEGKADEIVVSVDHPGYHDPKLIVGRVLDGFSNRSVGNIHTTLTREQGVLASLSLGKENDIILLTSGCINGVQLVKGKEIPHSDEEIIARYFKQSDAGQDLYEAFGETPLPINRYQLEMNEPFAE